jgi:hypothetical protein
MRIILIASLLVGAVPRATKLSGSVVDTDTGKPIPCRIEIRGSDGTLHTVKTTAAEGSAVVYKKDRGASSVLHTTLSAHPFEVELAPGTYTVTVQRGKEYLPETRRVDVGQEPVEIAFKLKRWINMAERGWYSGETHVHRSPEELPNLMLAEDLNVAFPFASWVTEAYTAPKTSNKAAFNGEPGVTKVDATHVFTSRNTEYEIFRVGKKAHTLGAIFILNHKTVFEEGVPPLKPVIKKAREEGALLELDKHNWPWSMMLAPVLKVDLYELANNHMWEADFLYRDFGSPAPEYMKIEKDAKGWTEAGWIDYTFQNYYALLDCGIPMQPTAGCASGVHPVPIGFGRVYVHVDGDFSYEAWLKGLKEGWSFVTTGPTLFVSLKEGALSGSAESGVPLSRIEIVVNGEVVRTVKPENKPTAKGGFASAVNETLKLEESGWIAARCFEDRLDKRVRFAHTAPIHVEVAGKPLRPRRVEVEFLVQRVEDEIARNAELLSDAAMDEYREALKFYKDQLATAR